MSIFQTGGPIKKITKVVPIFMTINNEYAPYAAAAMHSLAMRCDKNRYYRVIILHDGLSFVNRVKLRNLVTENVAIQFKKMTRNLYLKAIVAYCARRRRGVGDYFSSAVYYYRAFIPRLFPLYEKAIYIDSDTVLLGDIGELFDVDLGDNALGAVVDRKITAVPEFNDYVEKALGLPCGEYVNSGVLLMDLKKMRKMKYLSTMIELMRRYDADLIAPDQDYLNIIMQGHIMKLGSEWNAEPKKRLPNDTRLVHFNLFNKPWHHKNVPGEELFWGVARGTGFYGDLRRQQQTYTGKKQAEEQAKVQALIKKAAKLAEAGRILVEYDEQGVAEEINL